MSKNGQKMVSKIVKKLSCSFGVKKLSKNGQKVVKNGGVATCQKCVKIVKIAKTPKMSKNVKFAHRQKVVLHTCPKNRFGKDLGLFFIKICVFRVSKKCQKMSKKCQICKKCQKHGITKMQKGLFSGGS